jgi:hypothetical protein
MKNKHLALLVILSVFYPLFGFGQGAHDNKKSKGRPVTSESAPMEDVVKMSEKTFKVGSLTIKTDDVKKKVEKLMKDFTDMSLAISRRGDNYREEIDLTMRLFNNDESVQIQLNTKLSSEPKNERVRAYLTGLVRGNKFSDIKINKTDVVFVSELHLGADGKYHGHVGFIQDYQVWQGDRLTKQGSTKQDFEFVLEVYNDMTQDGKSYLNYRLFLSNLVVTQL